MKFKVIFLRFDSIADKFGICYDVLSCQWETFYWIIILLIADCVLIWDFIRSSFLWENELVFTYFRQKWISWRIGPEIVKWTIGLITNYINIKLVILNSEDHRSNYIFLIGFNLLPLNVRSLQKLVGDTFNWLIFKKFCNV